MNTGDQQPGAAARIAAAADAERRRIERALHDGIQQDLVAVSVRLQLARRLAKSDLGATLEVLDEVERDVQLALDRVRELASRIYPSVLEARGLPDAVHNAASAAGLAVTVDAKGLGRHPQEVEAAAYFFFRAALEAIAADAGPGARATLGIREAGHALLLGVECETVELRAACPGLSAARDRIDALGGVVSSESTAGHTRLKATIPLA